MKPCRISSAQKEGCCFDLDQHHQRFTHTVSINRLLVFGWCNKRTHRTIELFRAGHILDHRAPRSNQVPGILMDFRQVASCQKMSAMIVFLSGTKRPHNSHGRMAIKTHKIICKNDGLLHDCFSFKPKKHTNSLQLWFFLASPPATLEKSIASISSNSSITVQTQQQRGITKEGLWRSRFVLGACPEFTILTQGGTPWVDGGSVEVAVFCEVDFPLKQKTSKKWRAGRCTFELIILMFEENEEEHAVVI